MARGRAARSVRALAGVAVLAAPACDTDDGPPPATAAPEVAGAADTAFAPDETAEETPDEVLDDVVPGGMTVFVEFPRYLHAQRRLEVAFDNTGASDIGVVDVALRSPLFAAVPAARHDTVVRSGRRRDLQIELGAPVCPAPSGASEVAVTLEVDGDLRHGAIEVDAAPLERISATECGQLFVEDSVALGFGPEFDVTDDVVSAKVELARRATDEIVAIDAVRGTVLLGLRPIDAGEPAASLEPSQQATSLAVEIEVTRCDPHAVTESKKSFDFAMWVTIGERPQQYVIVRPAGDLLQQLQTLIDRCVLAYAGPA